MPQNGATLFQTLVAFAAVAFLGIILKLFFGRSRDSTEIAWPSGDPDDFGLLVAATIVDSPEDARAYRELLADAGIKATTSVGPDGRYRVLVFPAELDRARRVCGGA